MSHNLPLPPLPSSSSPPPSSPSLFSFPSLRSSRCEGQSLDQCLSLPPSALLGRNHTAVCRQQGGSGKGVFVGGPLESCCRLPFWVSGRVRFSETDHLKFLWCHVTQSRALSLDHFFFFFKSLKSWQKEQRTLSLISLGSGVPRP